MASKVFDSIKLFAPPRNKFDLSHERKFSFNMGQLVPVLVQEAVPGDKFRLNAETLIRMAPMLAPMMHRCDVFIHYWAVPYRLIWTDSEDYFTGGEDGNAAPIKPFIELVDAEKSYIGVGTLADYMGIPTPPAGAMLTNAKFCSLPFRAYQFIYNECYRDQDLIAKIPIDMGSGSDAQWANMLQGRARAWEKDYGTSARPWAQKGGAVSIPNTTTLREPAIARQGGAPQATAGPLEVRTGGAGAIGVVGAANGSAIDAISGVNITINDLRKSNKLQEWLEIAARAGSRYVEHVKAYFGMRSSDARLQRPEYLGGGKSTLSISEVLSSFQSDTGEIPQGHMAGHGIGVGNANGFTKEFEEHSYVIGIMSVLPKTAYQQGLNKMWSRENRYEEYYPQFAQLGEQAVKNKEIFYGYLNSPVVNDQTFGYQSRYSEYKYKESSVHGDFRGNLAYWHMGRIFDTLPVLNGSFVSADPTHRIFAVTDPAEHKLYCQMYSNFSALRPMPYYNTPQL